MSIAQGLRWSGAWMAAGLVLAFTGLAGAQPADGKGDEDIKATIQALKERIRAQDTKIAQLEQQQQSGAKANQDDIRRIVAEMQKDASAKSNLPTWLDNLKFYGDFRLRFNSLMYNSNNGADGVNGDYKSRNRMRYRLRFGFIKTWLDDQLQVGFRLASGNNNDPTTANQTLGESGAGEVGFAKRPIWIDQAWAKYTPKALPGFYIQGGKFYNPFLMNDIFWKTDVNPEGIYAEYTTPSSMLGPVELFAGAGYFFVREAALGPDSTMDTYQLGARWKITKDVKYTFGAYQQNWRKYKNSNNGTAGNAYGNDFPLLHIPDFRIIGATNRLDWTMFNLPWNAFADIAHNCGADDTFNNPNNSARSYHGQDNAYAFGVKVGQNKKKGDWSAKALYGWVEANALPGLYVDSDFGYANRQGFVFGPCYNLLDDLTVGVNVFITQPIFSPTSANPTWKNEDITTQIQADMIWRF